jgi:hypothetical protein
VNLAIGIAIAVLAGGVYYAWSLRVHPWRTCRRCKGRGRRDRVFRYARGGCARCGDRGRLPRLGIRVLTPERAKAMTAPKGSHKKADHRKSQ